VTAAEAYVIADRTPGASVIQHRETLEILVVRTSDLGFWLHGRGYRCLHMGGHP